jgi:hypothetical protein
MALPAMALPVMALPVMALPVMASGRSCDPLPLALGVTWRNRVGPTSATNPTRMSRWWRYVAMPR